MPDGPRCVSGRRAAICRRERGLLGIDMECDPVGSAQRLMATPDAEEFLLPKEAKKPRYRAGSKLRKKTAQKQSAVTN